MPTAEPRVVRFTDHARVKADLLGIARADIEDAVLSGHRNRVGNTGSADWLTAAGALVVAYNHPSSGDDVVALVVTIWRRV